MIRNRDWKNTKVTAGCEDSSSQDDVNSSLVISFEETESECSSNQDDVDTSSESNYNGQKVKQLFAHN